jgi:glycosyltransferase involved in cell wall biosynthesis
LSAARGPRLTPLDSGQLSLIVCTRNRLPALKVSLGTILELRCRAPWQLIVVDNGSTDGTWPWLRTIGPPRGATFEALQEPTPGLSRARNAGVRVARGEIVAFTDDDCYPTASYLNDILDVFASPEIDYCGGRVLLYDSADLPVTIQTSVTPLLFPPKTFISPGSIHGANMAFRRRVLETTGPFDVLLGAGSVTRSAEDLDLIFRASWCGYTGVFAPASTVMHHHRRTTQVQVARLGRGYNLGSGAFYIKHILRKPTRLLVVKNWYWSVRGLKLRGIAVLAREVRGALIYLWYDRVLRRR